MSEEQKPVDIDGEIEMHYTIDYISGAAVALSSLSEIDTMILSKSDELRVKRIRRKSLRILDICISEFYDELFESDDDD